MRYQGWDLTDPFCSTPRVVDVAEIDESGTVSFLQWRWPTSATPSALGAGVGLAEPSSEKIIVIDGPQALARPGSSARHAELLLNTPGRTPDALPIPGRPFQGYVRGSILLFEQLMARAGVQLLDVQGASFQQANLFEAFPGATWRNLAGSRLPAKNSRAGRESRLQLLEAEGLRFPPSMLPSHDQLDAALCAWLGQLTRISPERLRAIGDPVTIDSAGVLREGRILDVASGMRSSSWELRARDETQRNSSRASSRSLHLARTAVPTSLNADWVYFATPARAGHAETIEFVEHEGVICWPAYKKTGALQARAKDVKPGNLILFAYRGSGSEYSAELLVEVLPPSPDAMFGTSAMTRLPSELSEDLDAAGYLRDPIDGHFTGFQVEVLQRPEGTFRRPAGHNSLRLFTDVFGAASERLA